MRHCRYMLFLEALTHGLVSKVVPQDKLDDEVGCCSLLFNRILQNLINGQTCPNVLLV